MKKNVFWLAAMAAAVSLTGCSVDEVVDKAEVRSIGFDAFANKTSRANKPEGMHDSFDVWGAYDVVSNDSKQEVFNKRTVSWQTDTWSYGTPEAWVTGKEYEFAALAPSGITGAAYDYSNNKYNFGPVDANTSTQTDYMFATVSESVPAMSKSVNLTFNHTLSKVDFKFLPKTDEPNNWPTDVKIKVISVKLSGVLPTGSCEITNAATDSPTITWKDQNGTTVDFTDTKGYETTYLSGVAALEGPSTAWLVIPQTDGYRKVTVTCDITDEAGVILNYGVSASADIDTEWVANTHYTYTIRIGTNIAGTDPFITFDVSTVKGWDPGATTPVDVTPSN